MIWRIRVYLFEGLGLKERLITRNDSSELLKSALSDLMASSINANSLSATILASPYIFCFENSKYALLSSVASSSR